jgi:hypothetical protein
MEPSVPPGAVAAITTCSVVLANQFNLALFAITDATFWLNPEPTSVLACATMLCRAASNFSTTALTAVASLGAYATTSPSFTSSS